MRSSSLRQLVTLCLPFLFATTSVVTQEGLRAGMEAPEFKLPTIAGKTVTLREFQNRKVVIVHFWKSK